MTTDKTHPELNQLVTISIPTYNSGAFIERCLQAIKEQTYKNIEVNIVDGGSRDETVMIANRFECKVVKDTLGLLNARKIGADLAQGEFVLLLDSDQILEPDAITKLLKMAIDEHLDMLVLGEDVYQTDTLLEKLFQYDRQLIHAVKDFSPQTGVMLPRFYRKSILIEAFSNIPASALSAGGQDHAIIYFEAYQISKQVEMLEHIVKHIEPSSIMLLMRKFYRWGYTSKSARSVRYKNMLRQKEHFRKGMFRRGLWTASCGSIALLLLKGVPYYMGVLSASMGARMKRIGH